MREEKNSSAEEAEGMEAAKRSGVIREAAVRDAPTQAALGRARALVLADAERAFPAVRLVLFYRTAALRCEQLEVACAAVHGEDAFFLLAELEDAEGGEGAEWQVARYHVVSRQDWTQARAAQRAAHKILRLDAHLAVVPRIAPPVECDTESPLCSPQPSPQATEVMCVEVAPPLPARENRAVWLHEAPRDNCSGGVFYCSLLVDFLLLRKPGGAAAAEDAARTERKWCAHMDRHLADPAAARGAALDFMLAYVRARGAPQDAVLRGWLALEQFLFRRAPLDLARFEADLARHLALVDSYRSLTRHWQHAQWHRLRSAPEGRLWHQLSPDAYCVSAEWLLEEELVGACGGGGGALGAVRDGAATLDAAQFFRDFLPCLYGRALADAAHLAHYVAARGGRDSAEYTHLFGGAWSERAYALACLERELAAPLIKLAGRDLAPDLLFEFGARELQSAASPVMRAYVRGQERADQRRRGGGGPKERVLLSTHVDIEDLASPRGLAALPPCLARLAAPEWRKNDDRVALMGYLVDSGYGQNSSAVQDFMCRGKSNTEHNRADMLGLLRSRQRRHAAKQPRRISHSCERLANTVFEAGNVLRCAYEAEANGAVRRTNHTDDEMRGFRESCACALRGLVGGRWPPTIFHPLDYVSHQLSNTK